MAELKINIPDVAHIVVTGPTQCGKSIVMDRIEKMLKADFGATVISRDLAKERKLGNMDELADWEVKMVKDTTWILYER
tara:strand:- start:43 stop:279 length:237 start_codon:yes stop_codon:yes gene_type:complete